MTHISNTGITLCLLLASCSPPAPVPQAVPVTPVVERISRPVEAAGDATAEIKGKLSSMQETLSQARTDALTFKAEMERFRAEGMTKDEELARVWSELNKATERNMFLEEELHVTQESVLDLEKALSSARDSIEHAVMVAQQKDEEAFGLRDANVKLRGRLAKSEKALAKAAVYRFWVIAGACALGLLWLLREVVPLIIGAARRVAVPL